EGRDGPFDRALDSFDVGSIRLDRDSLSAIAFNGFYHRGSRAGVLRVRDRHARSICGQTFGNRGSDAARTAGDNRDLARQFLAIVIAHMLCSFFRFLFFVVCRFRLAGAFRTIVAIYSMPWPYAPQCSFTTAITSS